MSDFAILTDSSADLDAELVTQMEIHVLPLSFTIQDHVYHNYPDNRDMDPKTFYRLLREGETAATSAVNVSQYLEALEPILRGGQDVLILSFSSALSSTYHAASIAAEELRTKYPDRRLYTVDTLCASLGQGLLVYLAAQERAKGKSLEEVRDWVVAHKLNICHQFTVNDLHFLKRGGRVSAAAAAFGSMLQIKPVLHVDNDGRLTCAGRVRGRRASLKALVDKMEQTAIDPKDQTVFISHGDCPEDAQLVAQMVRDRFGVQNVYLNEVGPVIGAHSGPDTLALFYIGVER
jgi:DegV family protein with EDD domain